jgi:hypothetical protein
MWLLVRAGVTATGLRAKAEEIAGRTGSFSIPERKAALWRSETARFIPVKLSVFRNKKVSGPLAYMAKLFLALTAAGIILLIVTFVYAAFGL